MRRGKRSRGGIAADIGVSRSIESDGVRFVVCAATEIGRENEARASGIKLSYVRIPIQAVRRAASRLDRKQRGEVRRLCLAGYIGVAGRHGDALDKVQRIAG